jgi:2-polyprenylphenol 6-hydroxylase
LQTPATSEGKDIGQHLYLRRYERRRKHSAALMLAGMQGFSRTVCR